MTTVDRGGRRPFRWRAAAIAGFAVTVLCLPACRVNVVPTAPAAFTCPDAKADIWGYQDFVVAVPATPMAPISRITYSAGEGPAEALDLTTLRRDPGGYRFTLCVECLAAPSVTVSVEFDQATGKSPLVQTFRINHLPRVTIEARPAEPSGNVILDAGASTDPEGSPLTFEWRQGDVVATGPHFTARAGAAPPAQALLKVSDGTTVFYNLVTWTPVSKPDGVVFEPTFTDEKLKCTKLEVVDSGPSLLHPWLTLGPVMKKGARIELSGNKPTKSSLLMYRFEVRATLEADPTAVLREGQDVAATTNAPGDPASGKAKGHKRKSTKPRDYDAAESEAPYPDNPSAANPPALIQDAYEFHPAYGPVPFVAPDGSLATQPQPGAPYRGVEPNKDLRADAGGDIKLVWFDTPGFVIKPTMDVSHGAFFKGYFHAWMEPDLAKCKRYFTVVMEVNGSGQVTASELKLLN